eukprot:365829-Chlamydomonas_euryale.AAC.3
MCGWVMCARVMCGCVMCGRSLSIVKVGRKGIAAEFQVEGEPDEQVNRVNGQWACCAWSAGLTGDWGSECRLLSVVRAAKLDACCVTARHAAGLTLHLLSDLGTTCHLSNLGTTCHLSNTWARHAIFLTWARHATFLTWARHAIPFDRRSRLRRAWPSSRRRTPPRKSRFRSSSGKPGAAPPNLPAACHAAGATLPVPRCRCHATTAVATLTHRAVWLCVNIIPCTQLMPRTSSVPCVRHLTAASLVAHIAPIAPVAPGCVHAAY